MINTTILSRPNVRRGRAPPHWGWVYSRRCRSTVPNDLSFEGAVGSAMRDQSTPSVPKYRRGREFETSAIIEDLVPHAVVVAGNHAKPITPSRYQADWFPLVCLAAAARLVWAGYRWRLRRTTRRLDSQYQERLAERTRIAQDLHDTSCKDVSAPLCSLVSLIASCPQSRPQSPS
jgi:signal transduction histidine kinase